MADNGPDSAVTSADVRAFAMSTVTSRDGKISVTTTELGLPVDLAIEPDQLRREPAELATDILRLCARAARRAALVYRAQMIEVGVDGQILDAMGLPKPDDVAAAEFADESELEYEPRTWT